MVAVAARLGPVPHIETTQRALDLTHRSARCTARAADDSTGDELASSGSGALVEAADDASPCGLREAMRPV